MQDPQRPQVLLRELVWAAEVVELDRPGRGDLLRLGGGGRRLVVEGHRGQHRLDLLLGQDLVAHPTVSWLLDDEVGEVDAEHLRLVDHPTDPGLQLFAKLLLAVVGHQLGRRLRAE